MTELAVLRHGQASFGAADYDKLSDLGRAQSRAYGAWLAAHDGAGFDTVLTGTLVRHRDTLAEIDAVCREAGLALPTAIELAGLNEFDHRAVFTAFALRHPDVESVRGAERGRSGDARAMYRFLRDGLLAWSEGRLDDAVPEPWSVFRARVAAAARELALRIEGSRRALVVTSGGVMAQLAQIALDLPDARAVELNLSIRNCALCEFHASEGTLRMASWNTLPHLALPEQRAMWSHY
jgi:broad specificity phosphatase PhoE